jgi:hypothetical protein
MRHRPIGGAAADDHGPDARIGFRVGRAPRRGVSTMIEVQTPWLKRVPLVRGSGGLMLRKN